MKKARAKPKRPIGGGGQRHPASLANLRNAPAAPRGNMRHLTHGGTSAGLVKDVEAEVRELMDALGEAVPVRDWDRSVPVSDITAIEVAARALKRFRHVSLWCDMHGRIEEGTGAVKGAAEFELKAGRALADALDVLGCSPTAKARLGLDLVKTRDLALEMSALADLEDVDDAS